MTWRRDLLVAIAGNALCIGLISLGTFAILRTSPAGSFFAEAYEARDDPAARSAVADRYERPLSLLTDEFPFMLTVLGCAVAVVVGGAVGILASSPAFWLPIVAVAPLTASPLAIDPSAADVWLRAAAWGALAWGAAQLTRRWRSRARGVQA